MVLEDTPPTPTDFTSDSSPASSPDPYASSSDETPQLGINLAQLPSPAPIFGPLFGYTRLYLFHSIAYRVKLTSALMSRPVSADEASALAYWTAKTLAVSSWGRPLGLLAGGARAYQTRQTFRFPFVTPDPDKFKPEVVKIAGVELLRGMRARAIWHGLRGGAYGIFGSWVGGMVVSTYAATAAAVGEQRDPRLREVVAKMQAKAKEMASPRRARSTPTVGHEGDPTGQGQTPASELWKNHRRAIGGDDASPTAAGEADGFDSGSGMEMQTQMDDARSATSETDGAVLTDAQLRAHQDRPPRTRPPSTRSSPPHTTDFDPPPTTDDDDADPSPPSSRTSVWARIRQESHSAPPGRRPPRRALETPVPPEQDSATFGIGSADEERTARAEAQRLFDEQVERERRGGEFGGKEW